MKKLPYYTEQKMKKEKNTPLYSRNTVKILQTVFMDASCGHLPVAKSEEIVEKWRENKRGNKYVLKFDIQKFYLNIDHTTLLKTIRYYTNMFLSSEQFDFFMSFGYKEIEQFLKASPYLGKSLPIGSSLGKILAHIYLLPVITVIYRNKLPFLYFADDFLIFFKTVNKREEFYWSILLPLLRKYSLEINAEKTLLGDASNHIIFCGFEYKSGYFSIENHRVEKLKKWIQQTVKKAKRQNKSFKVAVKMLNKKCSAFFHYYAWGDVKTLFLEIDRVMRTCLLREYFSDSVYMNFTKSKAYFKKMRLVSALDIVAIKYVKKQKQKEGKNHSEFLDKIQEIERNIAVLKNLWKESYKQKQ